VLAALAGTCLPLLLIGCNPVENGGLKPPPTQTAEQQKSDLDRRIAEIQNNPHISEETKQRTIAMMRSTADKPPPGPKSIGTPKQ
jgi:ABC-type transport system involved in cytochrome bd biosynthesis fused ATPase/permease subunit